jgi:aspartyl-tRNA(Asn)/glutamyl-tRNA(Gln) amidotransferase subunit A
VTPVQSKPGPRLGTAPETPFAFPFNITQQPAASVPAGFDTNGLPIGLHMVGPQYGDAIVLRASRTFEKAQPFLTPHLESLREL